ncbi:MAG: glycosyltransferase family 9 protein [Rhodospirillales bacterium]|nr:glycosyltransferase family 9 protein [Rhodospirillales bacterium]
MKILFITYTRIGDAVLSTGILSHLVEQNPGARVTVACGPAAAPLFGPMPGVERVMVMRKQKRAGHWLRLWKDCVGQWWDLIVDLRGSAMAYILPALRRRVLRGDNGEHRVVRLGRLLDLDPPPAPRLWTATAHDELAQSLIADGPPVLAIGPTANWRGKEWRAGNFIELIARLTAAEGILPGARVAIFGGPGERSAAKAVIDSIPAGQRVDLVGRIDLPTVTACLRRCALYVGNDSGLMHMAAASGIPTLGLFGPSRVDHYAPWGDNSAFVQTAVPFMELFGADPTQFDHTTTESLMDSLSVDMAEKAAHDLWTRVRGTGT